MRKAVEYDKRLSSARQLSRRKEGHRRQIGEHDSGKGEHGCAEHLRQGRLKLCQDIEIEARSCA